MIRDDVVRLVEFVHAVETKTGRRPRVFVEVDQDTFIRAVSEYGVRDPVVERVAVADGEFAVHPSVTIVRATAVRWRRRRRGRK